MSYDVTPFVEPDRCEALIEDMNAFIAKAYTEANIRSRRSHVYEVGMDMEPFAFVVHCPGDPLTDDLPGFHLEELPPRLAALNERAVAVLGIERGRVLFNVGRYAANCARVNPHFDGELFAFEVDLALGSHVIDGIRPSQVALLTLRNETRNCSTTLHDADDKVVMPTARAGDLLVFDNLVYKHGVPATGDFEDPARAVDPRTGRPRWIRYTIGWRALEEGHAWEDGEIRERLDFAEAVARHRRFLERDWASRLPLELERATLPFPQRAV